jgi:hypothetical protein
VVIVTVVSAVVVLVTVVVVVIVVVAAVAVVVVLVVDCECLRVEYGINYWGIKPRTMRCTEYVARMGNMKNAYTWAEVEGVHPVVR